MKFAKFILKCSLFTFFLTNFNQCSLLRNSSEKKVEKLGTQTENKNILGENSNAPDSPSVDAVAYNEASNTNFASNGMELNYKTITPEIVDRVKREMPTEKISATADTVKGGNDFYYDGRERMLESQEECMTYSTRPKECVSSSHCGWCNDSNSCVKGGREGPSGASCSKSSFNYFAPSRTWDPLRKYSEDGLKNIDNNLSFKNKGNIN
jgi:hypothetical protein